MLEIVAITGLAGVVIGVLQLTGLGFTLTLTLTQHRPEQCVVAARA